MKRISNDVMNVLLQLRFLLKKLFELEDIVNREFRKFEDENLNRDNFAIPNPTVLLDYHRERYPALMSGLGQMTIKDLEDKGKTPSIIIEDMEMPGSNKESSRQSPQNSKLAKTQTAIIKSL